MGFFDCNFCAGYITPPKSRLSWVFLIASESPDFERKRTFCSTFLMSENELGIMDRKNPSEV